MSPEKNHHLVRNLMFAGALGGAALGVFEALPHFGVHINVEIGDRTPINANAEVDYDTQKTVVIDYNCGGLVSEYVGVNVDHDHFSGGLGVSKLYAGDALACADTGKIITTAKVEYFNRRITREVEVKKGSQEVLEEKTVVESKPIKVEFTYPGLGIFSPRIDFNNPANDAPLRPGMTPAVIEQTVATYKEEVSEGQDPYDSGVYEDNKWYEAGMDIADGTDNDVSQVAFETAQLALELDAFPTNGLKKESEIVQQNVYDQIQDKFKGAKIDMKVATPSVSQVLENRWQAVASGIAYLFPEEHFSRLKNGSVKFTAQEGDGVVTTATLGDIHESNKQVEILNDFIAKKITNILYPANSAAN